MDAEHSPEMFLAHLQAQVALHDRKEAEKRRIDAGKVATDDYAAIEDGVLLKAIDDLLCRIWNKDDENYRKGRMHLSRLAWDLRQRLRKNL